MLRVFGLCMAGENSYRLETATALRGRRSQSSPFKRSPFAYMSLATCCGEASVVAQEAFGDPQSEACRAPYGQIGVYGWG